MKRRLLNLLTLLSLLLCGAVCVLWVRSYRQYTEAQWGKSYETGFGWRLYDHSVSASDGSACYVRSYGPVFTAHPSDRLRWHTFLGFVIAHGAHGLVPDSALTANRLTICVPFWFIAAATAALPAARLIRRLRRHRPGHCQRCGYDLRATPDRCPECGATV